jgi:hypothetical protein
MALSFSAQPREDIRAEVTDMEPVGQALTTVLGKLGRAITEHFNEEKTTAVAVIDFSVAAIKRRRIARDQEEMCSCLAALPKSALVENLHSVRKNSDANATYTSSENLRQDDSELKVFSGSEDSASGGSEMIGLGVRSLLLVIRPVAQRSAASTEGPNASRGSTCPEESSAPTWFYDSVIRSQMHCATRTLLGRRETCLSPAAKMKMSAIETSARILHLFPNNHFVTRAYARFVTDLSADISASAASVDKTKLLLRE